MNKAKKITIIVSCSAFALTGISIGIYGGVFNFGKGQNTVTNLVVKADIRKSQEGYVSFVSSKNLFYYFSAKDGLKQAGPIKETSDYVDDNNLITSFDDNSFNDTLESLASKDKVFADFRIYTTDNKNLDSYSLQGYDVIEIRHLYSTNRDDSYYQNNLIYI